MRVLLCGALLVYASVTASAAQEPPAADVFEPIRQLLSTADRQTRRAAAEELQRAGDLALVPPLVDALFFLPRDRRREALEVLEALSGERPGGRYMDWVEVVGRRRDLEPPPGYAAFKLELLQRIDPSYAKIFYPGAPLRIRLEEVVWGGVPLDGIPTLEQPAHIPAAEADYLRDDEAVFGVAIGGEARAYPLRMLDWHELLNDVVGGEPVSLSYCTLCGSAVLYSTRTRGAPYTFGTSGLLYRSNKLMFDRQTYSLWSNLTGEPVIGRRARGSVRLRQLPVTRTTWEAWHQRFPDTTVLALDRELERRTGFRYRPGAARLARRGVEFPVWQRDDRLAREDEVYTLRLTQLDAAVDGEESVKAYELDALLEVGVLHDELGGQPLVLVADEGSGAVRAYARASTAQTFTARASGLEPGLELLDGAGAIWRADEDALRCVEGCAASTDAPPEDMLPEDMLPEDAPSVQPRELSHELPRLAGHVAFWFGWYGFYPHTELWPDAERPDEEHRIRR